MCPNTDKQYIEQVKSGDNRAFTNLYNKYYKSIRLVILNIVKNDDIADDLISVVFIKAWEKINSYVDHLSFGLWLKKIAVNTAIDYIRHLKNEANDHYVDSDDSFIELVSPDSDPESQMLHKENLVKMQEAFKLLSSSYQEIINMAYVENLTYQQMADKLEMPLGTLKSNLHKAKAKLRKIFFTIHKN